MKRLSLLLSIILSLFVGAFAQQRPSIYNAPTEGVRLPLVYTTQRTSGVSVPQPVTGVAASTLPGLTDNGGQGQRAPVRPAPARQAHVTVISPTIHPVQAPPVTGVPRSASYAQLPELEGNGGHEQRSLPQSAAQAAQAAQSASPSPFLLPPLGTASSRNSGRLPAIHSLTPDQIQVLNGLPIPERCVWLTTFGNSPEQSGEGSSPVSRVQILQGGAFNAGVLLDRGLDKVVKGSPPLPDEQKRKDAISRLSLAGSPEGLAGTPLDGRPDSSPNVRVDMVYEHSNGFIEVMKCAPGQRMGTILSDRALRSSAKAAAFFTVGKFLAEVHFKNMDRDSFGADPYTWRTICHGDFHWNNIFYDISTGKAKMIDAETSAYSTPPIGIKQSPLVDVMLFVLAPLGWGRFLRPEMSLVVYCLNAFLMGYIGYFHSKNVNVGPLIDVMRGYIELYFTQATRIFNYIFTSDASDAQLRDAQVNKVLLERIEIAIKMIVRQPVEGSEIFRRLNYCPSYKSSALGILRGFGIFVFQNLLSKKNVADGGFDNQNYRKYYVETFFTYIQANLFADVPVEFKLQTSDEFYAANLDASFGA